MKRLLLYVPAILISLSAATRADDIITITIPSNGLYLATFPFARTNGFPVPLPTVMSTQLVGGVNFLVSDNLLKWDSTTNQQYITFWKSTNHLWRQIGQDVMTTNTLNPGEGFWLRNKRPYPQTVTFTGTSWSTFANTYTVRIKTLGLSMLGFPYPVAVDMSEMGLDNVPRPGIFGDVILRWDSVQMIYVYYFYDADNDFGGGWRAYKDPDAQEPSILEAGEGFYIYVMEESDFNWQAVQP